MYNTRYIHKINPRPEDMGPSIELAPGDTSDAKSLAKSLRDRRILCSGQRIASYRLEADGRIVVFPAASIWHSIILTPEAS